MQFDGEDITNHPFIKTLADIVPNIHWVYHVAEQLLIAESHALKFDEPQMGFNWNHRNVDMMFLWERSPQGHDFWANVNAIEQYGGNLDELPWMVNGKLQYVERDKKIL